MREIDRLSGPTAYSDADFIAPQALVISDGKPFKSPAVNTVASTFWYYVASTIFMALCVTQDVLKLSQLRKVSTILVVGHVFVFLLAIFRHAEEAPIRVLCRKIKRGRIAVVLKGLEPSAFNSDPQAARAFERAVEACVSGSEQKKPGAVTVTGAKADENANRCTVTFTTTNGGGAFAGTPPPTINFTSGGWLSNNGWNYVRTTYTNNYALYDLVNVGPGPNAIVFSININNELTLDVNHAAHGTANPGFYKINGGSITSTPGVINANDTIELFNTSQQHDATFTVPSELAVSAGGGQDLARALRDGSFLAELRNSKLPALKGVSVEKNGAMIDKIDRIDKTEFEKLYAAGGKELLEAAVFEAIEGYFDGDFRASCDLDDPWDRFCTQFCALETFWREPASALYEKQVKIWLVLEDIDEIAGDLKKKRDNAKDPDHKELLDEKIRELNTWRAGALHARLVALGAVRATSISESKLDESEDESEDLWDKPAFARLTLEETLKELRKIAEKADRRERRKSADEQPTRWNWLRRKAKKRADDLVKNIKKSRRFEELRGELEDVLEDAPAYKDDLVLDEGARVSVKASTSPGNTREAGEGTIVSVNADGTFDVKPAVGDVWRKVGKAELDGQQPYQQLLRRGETLDGGAVTEAVLRATEACIDPRTLKSTPDTLVKREYLVESKVRLDKTVLPPLLRAFALNCFPSLKGRLDEIKDKVGESGTKIELICEEEKSVKKSKRMVAKMVKEIAGDEGRTSDKNRKWQPVSASVRDVLRATFVCENPKAMRDVFEALNKARGLKLRKLKNKVFPAAEALARRELAALEAAKADKDEKTARTAAGNVVMQAKIPFNLHALYEFQPVAERPASILVEIQIHDAEIRKQSGAQHKFYEISRAGGSEDLLKVAAGGDSDSEDLVKQGDMEKIAKRKSYLRWRSALDGVLRWRRGQKSRRMSGQE